MNNAINKVSILANKQYGFTLVEILVTVFILAVGSLGIASLQLAGLKYTSGSYARTQAVLLADDMANRIKSNRTFALNILPDGTFGGPSPYITGPYGTVLTATNDCIQVTCTSAELAEYDLESWIAEVERVLPAGQGQVTIIDRVVPGSGVTERQFNIGLRWRQVANSTSPTAINANEIEEVEDFTFRISI